MGWSFPQTMPMEMFHFPKNLYFSQVAKKKKKTYPFKVTIGSIYTTRVLQVSSHHWLLVHHGSEICGSRVRSKFRGSGVRGSPRVN